MYELLTVAAFVVAALLADLLLLGDTGVVAFLISLFQARAPDQTGVGALIDAEAVVQRAFAPGPTGVTGVVRIRGELWSAILEPGAAPPAPGDPVVVTRVAGLVLTVRPRGEADLPGSPRHGPGD
jgi:membrane protein implicated in regulation of membrane protease activity